MNRTKEQAIMGLFRKRDLAVLVLVVISLYLSYVDRPALNYVIEPAWFIDQRETHESQSFDCKLVPPIITDLEGDGVNEIVMITKDLKLKVEPLRLVAQRILLKCCMTDHFRSTECVLGF